MKNLVFPILSLIILYGCNPSNKNQESKDLPKIAIAGIVKSENSWKSSIKKELWISPFLVLKHVPKSQHLSQDAPMTKAFQGSE